MEHVKKREEISKEFTWALEDLYQDQAAWSEDLEKIRKLAQELFLQRNACGRCRKSEKGTEFLQ